MVQRALRSGRMPHAYIFHGPEGVGKEMLAGRLARLLLCPDPREVDAPVWLAEGDAPAAMLDACCACEDCTLADAGTHPDVVRVYRELNKYHPDAEVRKRKAIDLSVDVVRHFLIDAAATRPGRGRAKVFVVPEAERMSTQAQNALLKTLEEPPEKTYLFLLTRSIDRLLDTTRSRCQPVPFQTLPVAFVAEQLRAQRDGVSEPVAAYLAKLSGGQLGPAVQACDDGHHEVKTALGDRLAKLGRGDSLSLSKELSDTGKKLAEKAKERHKEASDTEITRIGLRALLAMASEFYRDALREAVGASDGLTNADQGQVVAALARRGGAAGATEAIRQLAAAETHLNRNANVQLTMDALSVGLCRAGSQ